MVSRLLDEGLERWLGLDAAVALRRYAAAEKVGYVLRRPFVGGPARSMSAVVMEKNIRGETQNVILSLVRPGDHTNDVDARVRYDEAWTVTPEFAAAHLAALIAPPLATGDGRLFLLQKLSGGVPRSLHPLNGELRGLSTVGRGTDTRMPRADNRTTEFGGVCAGIVASLLNRWNDKPAYVDMAVQDFLTSCGRRLSGIDLRSALVLVAREFGGIEERTATATVDYISTPGRTLPALVGRTHGGLHGSSVLVARQTGAKSMDYWLIDLVAYSSAAPVVRDPMSLIVSVVTTELPDLMSDQRDALIRLLVTGEGGEKRLLGWLSGLIREVLDAARTWALRFCSAEEWRRQELLCLVMCAATAAQDAANRVDRLWWLAVAARTAVASAAISTREPGKVKATATPRQVTVGYSGQAKVLVCRRLSSDWQEVADLLEISLYERRAFERGREPQCVWEWLEVRGRLQELPDALRVIGRTDLADELAADTDRTIST